MKKSFVLDDCKVIIKVDDENKIIHILDVGQDIFNVHPDSTYESLQRSVSRLFIYDLNKRLHIPVTEKYRYFCYFHNLDVQEFHVHGVSQSVPSKFFYNAFGGSPSKLTPVKTKFWDNWILEKRSEYNQQQLALKKREKRRLKESLKR